MIYVRDTREVPYFEVGSAYEGKFTWNPKIKTEYN